MKTPPFKEAPVTPMAGSTWWLSSDTVAVEKDLDSAVLAIRLQLAVAALVVQMRAGSRTDTAAETAVRMRDQFQSFMTTAAYTKEALMILTGSRDAVAREADVRRLAIS